MCQRPQSNFDTGPMWLVYVAEDGTQHFQPWADIDTAGPLIDPHTGDDLQVVGWTTEEPR